MQGPSLSYPWLAWLTLSPTELQRLELALLSGRPALLEPYLPLLSSGGVSLRELAMECVYQAGGIPAKIQESTATLAEVPPADGLEARVWCERKFLRGFAFQRLGRHDLAAEQWSVVLANAGYRTPIFRERIRVEAAVSKLNRGDFLSAIQDFGAALNYAGPDFDLYTFSRAIGCRGLAHLHLGEFEKAEACLKQEARLLSSKAAPGIASGLSRMWITLALKRDEFEKAEALLKVAMERAEDSQTTHAYLEQLRTRLLLSRNRVEEAEASLRRLEGLVAEARIPIAALDLSEEIFELHLRRREIGPALEVIGGALEGAIARRDEFAQFRIRRALAEALGARGQRLEALDQMEEVIRFGEERHYWPDLVQALLHAAGLAFQARDLLRFRVFALKGKRVAERLGLAVKESVFSYLLEFHHGEVSVSKAFIELLKHGARIGPELEYYLNRYDIVSQVRLSVDDGRRKYELDESVFRGELLKERGVFWFPSESKLLATGGEEMQVVSLSDHSASHSAFLLALGREDGFLLEEVHALRSSAPFHPFRHTSAARMVLARLRQDLKPAEVGIEFNRNLGRYFLICDVAPLTVRVVDSRPGLDRLSSRRTPSGVPGPGARDREQEILREIETKRFVQTAELCKRMGITRQSLHPYLVRLSKRGRIRLVRKGPASGYVLKSYLSH